MANAKNNFSLDIDHLFIKSITADMGKVLKRYFPRARGSAFVIRRKLSHVNLVLELRKTGVKSKSRFALFKKDEKPPSAKASGDLRPAEMSVDQKEATTLRKHRTPRKSANCSGVTSREKRTGCRTREDCLIESPGSRAVIRYKVWRLVQK